MRYDLIVAGLGAMGSFTALSASRRGLKVLGLDRFEPPHQKGSSHGQSRIIRRAYFNSPEIYFPMLEFSFELWEKLQREADRQLFLQTGVLLGSGSQSRTLSLASASVHTYGINHQHLSDADLRTEFPAFSPASTVKALFEPEAGVLLPETSIETALTLARQKGAELQFHQPVLGWSSDENSVVVETAQGTFQADQLALCTGPWLSKLLDSTEIPLTVERQVLFWFEPRNHPELFAPGRFPTFIWEFSEGSFFYGMPDLGQGVKVALHHRGQVIDPDFDDPSVSPAEVQQIRELLSALIPEANGLLRKTAVCRYTNTPDEHFVIDRHPNDSRVVLVSPCSGHGFKFAPVIGEIATDLITGRESQINCSPFSLSRFESST